MAELWQVETLGFGFWILDSPVELVDSFTPSAPVEMPAETTDKSGRQGGRERVTNGWDTWLG